MATTQDYRLGVHTFPRGWLAVARSSDIGPVPSAGRFCGEDIVLYRDSAGSVRIMEAYCPHMGAHLAIGAGSATALTGAQRSGDDIRCPNHGWLFGPDGKLKEIAYSGIAVPSSLCLRTWRAEERAGCVFAWHDPEGGPPDYALPECREWSDPTWVTSDIDPTEVMNVHPVELAEHGVDKIHNANVHGADRVQEHTVTFVDHRAQTTSTTYQLDADGNAEPGTTVHARYTGPGLLLAEVTGARPAIFFFTHAPVDDGTVRGFHGVALKCEGPTRTEQDDAALEHLRQISLAQFRQDLEIFKHKRPTLRPVQIPGDGPFRRYRQWYSQFYATRADAERIRREAAGEVNTPGIHDGPWVARASA